MIKSKVIHNLAKTLALDAVSVLNTLAEVEGELKENPNLHAKVKSASQKLEKVLIWLEALAEDLGV